jgi:hypothetical protein
MSPRHIHSIVLSGVLALALAAVPQALAGTAPTTAAPPLRAAAPPGAAALPLSSAETDSPAVTSLNFGRTDLFTRSSAGDLLHRYRRSGGWWTRSLNLGGDIASQPAAVSWASGRMDVFARGTDNALWQRTFTDGAWLPWKRLGGLLTSAPSVASQASGRLDVFVRNTDDGVSYKSFRSGSGWAAWKRLGGAITSSPAATSWASGRLDVVVRNVHNDLSHKSFSNGTWSSWQRITGATLTSQPAIASPGTGQLDVVARSADNTMQQVRFASGSWSSWSTIGTRTFTSGPGAGDRGNDVQVVGRSSGAFVYESTRPGPGFDWSAWTAVDQYLPFRRLATWVDTLDYASLSPVSAVANMQARGVRTLFLSTARFNSANDFFDETEMGQWLDAAHAAGLEVVGWYVPAYGDMARDVRRTVAIGEYRSPGGQRFDAIGVDIERYGSDGEVDHATFNTRLVTHLSQVRAASPSVIAAIVPSPFGTDPGNRWEGFPWSSIGPRSEVVVPMALWSFRAGFDAAEVHDWVEEQIDRTQAFTGRPVHTEGGVIGEGSTPVTADRVQAFVDAVIDAGGIGGSQYDYATMPNNTTLWTILAQLNDL